MRSIKRIIFILIAVVGLMLQGCDNYLDVNEDPNNPSNVSVDLVLPAAQASVVIVTRGAEISTLGGFWAQYYTQSPECQQYQDIDQLRITTDWADRLWIEAYAGGLNDLKNVYTRSDNNSYKLIAEVLSCYTFQILADLFDQIPYSEALQGSAVKSPKYDSGEEIYPDLLARLDAALAAYAEDDGGVVKNDMIFDGDMNAWVRFANSLKLKILMRMSYSSIADNTAALDVAQNADHILADVTFDNYVNQLNRKNPIYENEKDLQNLNCDNWRASRSLISYLDSLEDGRVEGIYVPSATGSLFNGNLQGNNTFAAAGPNNSFATSNINPTDPSVLMSRVEVLLLRAEAEARFGSASAAKALYDQAVTADFARRGGGSAADFIGVGGVYEYPEGGSIEDQVKAIAYQRWIAMATTQNIEGFFERNRTGYPEYLLSGRPDTLTIAQSFGKLTHHRLSSLAVGQNPKRVWFPNVSVQSNSNSPSQPASLAVKVWWDKK